MQQDIRTLVLVQDSEVRIRTLEADTTALPKRLAHAETGLGAATTQQARVNAALKQGEADRRRMESDVRDQRQRIVKLRAQMDNVKTNEQLTALQHEIKFAEVAISELEDQELASMEQSEKLDAELVSANGAVAAAQKNKDEETRYVRSASGRLHADLDQERKRRVQLRADADAELLATYDRIAKSRKTGMAEVIASQCQGCHMQLRPQQWNSLRAGTRMNCESCGRMLYYDEGNDKDAARQNAGKWDVPA